MDFDIEQDILIIRLPKEIDHHNCGPIKEGADNILLQHNIREIVFDFSQTDFMDSSGIGVLVGRYKNISCFGGVVSAIYLSKRIRKIFAMSGLDNIIRIYEVD